MRLKNKNTKTKNKNMIYAKPTWKHIFIMLTYANMNMRITWQGYGVRSCLKFVLNRLKEMRDLTSIYIPLRPNSKKFPKRFICVHHIKKLIENLPN
jgi:hypothetical protein